MILSDTVCLSRSWYLSKKQRRSEGKKLLESRGGSNIEGLEVFDNPANEGPVEFFLLFTTDGKGEGFANGRLKEITSEVRMGKLEVVSKRASGGVFGPLLRRGAELADTTVWLIVEILPNCAGGSLGGRKASGSGDGWSRSWS